MTDNRNPFGGDLSARLRAHENRAPGGMPPDLAADRRGRAWAPIALIGAAGLVAGAVLVALLVQPSRPPAGEGTPSPSSSASESAASSGNPEMLVAVPTQPPYTGATPQACMAAELTGTLVVDETDGLAVEDPSRHRERVVWPYGYVARESSGGRQLLDASGHLVAVEGDHVHIGGGEVADGEWAACPDDIAVIGASPAPSVLTEVTAIPMDGLLPGDRVVAMGTLGDRWLAVGRPADGLGLWVQQTGESWYQVSDQEPPPANVQGGYTFTDLAVGKSGAVAVGYWFLADSEFGTPRIAFTQGDMHWTMAFGPSNPAIGECGLISAATETDSGWVAVGGLCGATGEAGAAAAWISANGTQWSEVPIPGLTAASDVARGPDRVVAAGGAPNGTGAATAVSFDGGGTWQSAALDTPLSEIVSIAFHSGLYVAAGSIGDANAATASDPAIWVSTDGLAWELAYRGGATHSIGGLIEMADQVVAVGGQFPSSAWAPDQGGQPLADTVEVWTSTDGRTWDGPRVAYASEEPDARDRCHPRLRRQPGDHRERCTRGRCDPPGPGADRGPDPRLLRRCGVSSGHDDDRPEVRPAHRAGAARDGAVLQGMAAGGRPPDAHEQPRPRGCGGSRAPHRLRRHGPRGAQLGGIRRDRRRAPPAG